jgi:hypothetical protein
VHFAKVSFPGTRIHVCVMSIEIYGNGLETSIWLSFFFKYAFCVSDKLYVVIHKSFLWGEGVVRWQATTLPTSTSCSYDFLICEEERSSDRSCFAQVTPRRTFFFFKLQFNLSHEVSLIMNSMHRTECGSECFGGKKSRDESRLTAQPRDQGCQMVYFQTKNPNLGKFQSVLQWKI